MPITVNQNVLSSEIVSKLKGTNEKPFKYLDGNFFSDYCSLEDSSNVYEQAAQKPNQTTRGKVFLSKTTMKEVFLEKNLALDTPRVIYNFPNGTSEPIASFADLSTFVVNSFLYQTNIRKSEFRLLRNIQGDHGYGSKEAYSVYKHALLTDKAILGTNEKMNPFPLYYVNNQVENSRTIIDSADEFFSELNQTHKDKISQLTPTYDLIKNNGWLDAERVGQMIDAVEECTEYIANKLTCLFAEYDLSARCLLVYHKKVNPGDPDEISSFSLKYYEPYTIVSYESLFGYNINVRNEYWATAFQGPVDERFSTGKKIYPDKERIDLYCVSTRPVKYITNTQYANNKTLSQIIGVDRPEYVRSRILDGSEITEHVQIFTTDFELPLCKNYFKKNANIPAGHSLEFNGWKLLEPTNLITDQEIDYSERSSGNIPTSLYIDKDYKFKAVYTIYGPPIPPPYDSKTVDLRIRNNIAACQNGQEQKFCIKIPLNGNCSKVSLDDGSNDSNYSLIGPDGNVVNVSYFGLKLKRGLDYNRVKKVKVQVKVTGNTQHKGEFKIYAHKNNSNTSFDSTSWHEFTGAETAHNEDNFGNYGEQWTFREGSYETFNFEFDFSNATPSKLADAFLIVRGNTGYSTDDKNGYYPYRCRFEITVTEATLGNIYV